MVGLAQALQLCAEQSGASSHILCSAVRALQRCLEPLIERDDLLDASMLEVAEEESVTSPNPAEEARLPDEESEHLEE